jgi:UDP-4-amino-4,6-dideoxy-N-acetyl-beta-L-altrosamine transaminase
MASFIPYGRQHITPEDIAAVTAVLQSDFLTQGPAIPRFEQAVASQVGARHAVAVNSATAALHIACLALELGPGDVLWTVPNTFVASANCARYCGADVDFVDIDPRTWNLSLPLLREKLAQTRRAGTRLPKIVVPVHFAGQPTDQEEIQALSREYGFKVIEDASHAIGASRHGEKAGSCRWSDIVIFSFHPVKIITTGEGGLALTNNPVWAERMATLRTHGITRDPARFTRRDEGAWHYEQQSLGLNYRLTDLQAALGSSQLTRLEEYVARRNELAAHYDTALAGLPVRRPFVAPGNRSAWHLYPVRVDATRRRSVFDAMRAAGIGVNVHYTPVHLQPYYRQLGFAPGCCPEAEAHGAEVVTLPLHPLLTAADQARVVDELRAALR